MSSRVFAFSVKLPESSVPQTSANIAPVDVAENNVKKRYVLLTRDPIVHFFNRDQSHYYIFAHNAFLIRIELGHSLMRM